MHNRTPRFWLLCGIILVAGTLTVWQPVSLATALVWGQWLTSHPFALAASILVMILLFTFAMPASLFVWLIAPFYAPWLATLLLSIGSTAGALGAYFVSSRIRHDWQPKGNTQRIIRLLERRSDAAVQCALRILPGFPHAVVNYASGFLRLPLATFLFATIVGLAIKWGVYTSAIHGAVVALEAGEPLVWQTVVPLICLAILLIGGNMAKRYWNAR